MNSSFYNHGYLSNLNSNSFPSLLFLIFQKDINKFKKVVKLWSLKCIALFFSFYLFKFIVRSFSFSSLGCHPSSYLSFFLILFVS